MRYSRNFISMVERGKADPGPRFLAQLDILEREVAAKDLESKSVKVVRLQEESPLFKEATSNAVLSDRRSRKIPVYSFIQAGTATDFDTLPESWDDTIEYEGTDRQAFALRIAGDSMEPKYPQGAIVTLSPAHPPNNGSLVGAKIKEEGVVFKLFHHSGDGHTVTLSSFNPIYKDIVLPREKFHWIYRAVGIYQRLT